MKSDVNLTRSPFFAFFVSLCFLTAGFAVEQRPNVLLVWIDNVGYGDLGCYGNRENKTPHMDRLAKEGVRCTDFYIGSPSCSPSRGALLTGRHPERNGLNYQLRTGEAGGADVVAEFVIGDPDIEDAVEEAAGGGGAVGVGFPGEGCVVGEAGDEFERVGQVDGGLAAEEHEVRARHGPDRQPVAGPEDDPLQAAVAGQERKVVAEEGVVVGAGFGIEQVDASQVALAAARGRQPAHPPMR